MPPPQTEKERTAEQLIRNAREPSHQRITR
jgi:hypothetical protein